MANIAIFDSGVGGLSILKAVREHLPEQSFLFVSDNQGFPYGTKSAQELAPRIQQCARRIVDQFDPDVLVIACNTASTLVLQSLREQLSLPIVGVVPAIKPAAAVTKSSVIGLLATPATVQRQYTSDLIDDFAPNCEVITVGSSLLVEIAEQKIAGAKLDLALVRGELQAILDRPECDTLILACTHFPLLNNEIQDIFQLDNHSITLIDSGQGIARRVDSLLPGLAIELAEEVELRAAFTQELALDNPLQRTLSNLGFRTVGALN